MLIYYIAFIGMAILCAGLTFTKYFFIAPAIPLACIGVLILYRIPILGMILVLFFIPFEGIFEQYPFLSVTKLSGFAMVLLGILYLAQRKPDIHILINRFWAPVVIFLLALFASYVVSIDSQLSQVFLRRLLNSLIIFVIVLIFFSSIPIKTLLYAMAFSVGLSALLSFFFSQASSLEERGSGFVSDPNYYAMLILFTLPFAIHACKWAGNKMIKCLWAACVLFMLVALVNTFSRAAILILLFMSLVLAWQNRTIIRHMQAKYMGILLLALTSGLFVAAATVPQSVIDRITSLKDIAGGTSSQDLSLGRRTSYIVVGGEQLSKKPFIGSGIGTYPVVYANSGYSKSFSFSKDNPDIYRRAHNTYLEIFTETGLIGGFCFLMLQLMAYRNFLLSRRLALKNQQTEHAQLITALVYSLASMTFFMLFLSATEHKYYWFILAVSIGIYQQQIKDNYERH